MRFESTVTKQGMPLYLFPMPSVKSVALGVLVSAGTRDESWPKEAGLAHAFEHMVFQGNTRLGNSKAIAEEIEAHGGLINAWTSKETTFYERMVPDYALLDGINSLAGQLTLPLFRKRDIKNEMKNIVEEIKQSNDDPQSLCIDNILEVVFGNHPLAQGTLGLVNSVTSFSKRDFSSWQERFYHPENFVFVAAGNVTMAKFAKAVNKFSFGEKGRKITRSPISHIGRASNCKIVERDIEQANICLGALIGSAAEKDTKALQFYSRMIGGGMSFPLFQEVRDKRGLCYTIDADVDSWSDKGIFNIYVGTDPGRAKEAIDCIRDVVWKYRTDKNLFAKARKLLLGRISIGFCNPASVIERAAETMSTTGFPKSPEELAEEFGNIKLSDVTKAVERHLNPDNFSYAYVVPKGTKIG